MTENQNAPQNLRPIACWLLATCAMVFLTLIVGGVTRLTESGLSIVEWQPLLGALPPLTDADWRLYFEKYQQIPQFQLINHSMKLDEFKSIFWWEWAHRLSGRTIGLVYALPLVFFWLRGRIPADLKPRLILFLILGGLQGAMGWYMVKSGLVHDVRVSQYRLTAHLGLAFLIFGLMFWTALGLLQPRGTPNVPRHLLRLAGGCAALVFLMVLSGGFVAGIRGGLGFNTFPLMDGHFIPPDAFAMTPWWLNFFANISLVQFDHRMVAWLLILLIPLLCWQIHRHAPAARNAARLMLLMLAIQVSLGISTLLLHVPIALASMHQAGAMLLFATVLFANHRLRCRPTA